MDTLALPRVPRGVCVGGVVIMGLKRMEGRVGRLMEGAALSNSPPWEEAIMFSFPICWRSCS